MWKTPKQRQHLKPAFLRGLKFWGLAKQVRVYAARDLTPRSRDITWYSENLLGEFASSSHTKENKMAFFTNFDIFST